MYVIILFEKREAFEGGEGGGVRIVYHGRISNYLRSIVRYREGVGVCFGGRVVFTGEGDVLVPFVMSRLPERVECARAAV